MKDDLLIFSGHKYYPSEGVDDFVGFGDKSDIDALINSIETADYDDIPPEWVQIVDRETMKIILYGECSTGTEEWEWWEQ